MSGDAGARRQAAGAYVRALFGPAPEGSLVEMRFRVPSGMDQRFMPASREGDVVDAVLSLALSHGGVRGCPAACASRRADRGCSQALEHSLGRLRHARVGRGDCFVQALPLDGRGLW